jgi:hypothetical protein
VPVASDSYTIPIEGANPELVGFLKTTAHELGMTRRQTAAIAQRYDAMVQKKMAADAAGYNQAFIGSLQKAWGEGFQNNINTAIEYSTQLQQDMPALGELLGGHKDAAIAYLLNELATAKGFKKTLGQTFFPNGLAK